MAGTETDHYFGELNRPVGSDELIAPLRELLEKARMSGGQHFTEQLRRVIGRHGCLVASDGSTAPPFAQLLDNLDTTKIGLVRITGRTDVNVNTGTLQCTLVFVEGPFHIRPDWCAWKELRASEIIGTLLIPLIRHGLLGRIVLPQYQKDRPFPTEPADMVRELFQLAGEPYSPVTHGRLEGYTSRIDDALRGVPEAL